MKHFLSFQAKLTLWILNSWWSRCTSVCFDPCLHLYFWDRSFHKRSIKMHFFSGKTGVCQNRGWHQLLTFSCPSKSFFQHQIFPKFLCHFVSLFYFLFIPGEAGVAAVFHSIASTQEPLDAEYHFCNFILIGICAETLHAISCRAGDPFPPQTIQPYSQDRFLFPFHYRKEN